ncbi:MAG: sigma-70 family RNA polymerase sigma factor [Candidatus Omnitrophota bacterium]
MSFDVLFSRIEPRLKIIAKKYSRREVCEENDLFQEMCLHLWQKFPAGLPDGINESYVVKGCEFCVLNYIRVKIKKVIILSLEEPIDEGVTRLKDVLNDGNESLDSEINKKLLMENVKDNEFSRKEKEVFSLLLEGYTTREIGGMMNVSHVMVVKYKRRIMDKCKNFC